MIFPQPTTGIMIAALWSHGVSVQSAWCELASLEYTFQTVRALATSTCDDLGKWPAVCEDLHVYWIVWATNWLNKTPHRAAKCTE